jgi:hypothetical protein
MHGGPDTLYVTIKRGELSSADTIYSRIYECSDVSAFDVQWKESRELTVSYGSCDSGRWHTPEENKVLKKDSAWGDIKIDYRDSGHVATK